MSVATKPAFLSAFLVAETGAFPAADAPVARARVAKLVPACWRASLPMPLNRYLPTPIVKTFPIASGPASQRAVFWAIGII